ncbi:YadA-like family protein [Salmonella enterica subsp. enterica serovar Derby]|uniref:YadA-like family protein n=1 Tax=Salmonella TaxID=590 RepID=UPI00073565BA|nr:MULTISPECIES: YadA-like family protein [Salmonella]QVC76817.1 YadA-like family protein [Salmonella enterica subsp. enterica serovar Derby str. 626]WGN06767.1 YadA-like family protein [Salmonella enterica subsp. enterica serovar Reading]AWN10066.1 adhesin [Salmonella enterica subsp. enterica serovar Derby]KTF62987.1 adhesin [Salmonella enterica subsp. enterica serovar Derby]MBM8904149.1 YadA-like family protein [Salmonella enterica]
MNKIFKVIWNPATGNFTVASETAKGRGKKSGRRKLLVSALVAGGLMSSFGASASVSLDGGTYSDGTELTDAWIAIGKGAKASSVGGSTASISIGVNAISAVGATAVGYDSHATGQSSVSMGQLSTAAGSRGVAIGSGASAAGDYTVALAVGSSASGESAVAIGQGSAAQKKGSVALGHKASSSGEKSVALGASSKATGDDSLALGRNALGNGTGSIAMGAESEANGLYSLAFGANSIADADNTVALGYGASATKAGAMVFGQAGKADGLNSIALGNKSQASSENSIAIGQESYSGSEKSIAIGSLSNVTGVNSVALGTESTAAEDNTVSVGNDTLQRKIVHMAKGDISSTSTDAINGSQLYDISKSVADRLGGGASVSTAGVVNAPNYKLQSGNFNNVGDALKGIDDNTLQWDSLKKVYSAEHGSDATSTITNVKDGALSASSTDAVNGSQLKTTNDNVATNTTNITNLTGDVANNTTNITNLTNDVAANTTSITNLTDTVTNLGEDALAWDDASGAFTAAHGTDATSKITNVKDGDLTTDSTDAVNGSQLKTTNDNVATNTTNITNLTGDVANNTTNITNLTNDVAANTTSITNLTDTVTNLGEDALKWDDASGVFTAAHGTNATSKITNVKDGDLTTDSTDAVNGSQLKTTNDNVATNTTNITNLTGDVANNTTNITNLTNDVAANTTSITNLTDTVTNLGEDALKWDDASGVFTAAHGTNATSKITNVTAGTISSTSTDAVNGGQLFSLSDSLADYFGGNASVDENGVFTGPSYTIGSNSYDSVGDALAAINTSFSTSLGDALLWDETASAFSAGHGGNASKITNVANGAISETSTDAINGGQLYGVSNSVVDALGGNATVNADGSISAPTYSIANTDYNNVGDALDAIDSTLDDALLWDATAGENGAFSASRDGKASVITNVANGDISETSTDAINGSQLFATNTLINQQNEIINQIAGNTSETYIEENGAGLNYVRTNDTGLTFIDASASGTGATAVGYNAAASGESSVAIGQNSSSTVDTGIALGSSSVSSRVIAKSSRETSVTEDGVVIGYDTTDGELLGALSIGDDGKYRQIINVADGTEAHDAVTVRQLQNAIGAVTTTPTKYYHANSTEEDSLAVGTDSLAMGAKTIVNADAGIGIGLNTLVMADAINGIAIGSNARAYHANSIAMGNGSQTTRGAQTDYTAYNMDTPQNSVGEFSVGSEDGQRQITNVAAGSADTDAVNVSQLKVTDSRVAANTESINNLNTQVSSLDTRVTNIENGIGDIVTTGSTKYFKTNTDGADANAQGADSVAIGSGSIAAAENSVALGTNSVADEANTVSVGSSTQQRRITNVAAGVNNTDAVNVAQLKASEAGSVRYETNADGSVNYSVLNLGDGSGGTTRIGNVSAAVNDTDAVNYAQLKRSVEEANTYTDQKMGEMNSKIKGVENKMSGGIASAMAMAGLPQAYAPGANMTSIAGGTFNGESAVAIGVSMVSESGGWVYKLQGTSNSQGDYSAAIGAGFQW